MGLAMIFVFLSHAQSETLGFMPTGIKGEICKYGFLGVDVFIFLSAYGLCFSLARNDLKTYFLNRIERILPTWFLVLTLVHIAGIFVSHFIPSMNFTYPRTILDCLWWYTGLGFFFNTCSYEWYVPTILLFYTFAPALFKMSRNSLLILAVLIMGIVVTFENIEITPSHLHIMIERLPVFILGFAYYKFEKGGFLNRFLTICLILAIVLIFAVVLFCDISIVPTTILFAPCCPLLILLISFLLRLIQSVCPCKFLSFIGSISLEFYLIHLYRRPQFLVSLLTDNCYIQLILAFVLCTAASYIIHRTMQMMPTFRSIGSKKQ